MTSLELLAPAKNASVAMAAIDHGADAVYIGASSHGARSAAANSVEDIAAVCDYAHKFGVKVYVTINTIIYDNELRQVEELVNRLYKIGVDALIVQDMALLRMNLPPIALHASTQCDTRTVADARFLEQSGFSQIVLARECTLDEIRNIAQAVNVPVEAFVHGALCVCYSGDCYASYVATGRSANRGECAQMCRLPYNLVDADTGNVIVKQKHLLSLRDMQRLGHIADLARAGVRSFKIEGRLKDAEYVKNVVAAYRQAIDALISANQHEFCRSSYGTTTLNFTPDISKSFNRGFTPYFLIDSNPSSGALANFLTPKSIGTEIGVVESVDKDGRIKARVNVRLNNGDGLGYFNSRGEFCGFRLNRCAGDILYPANRPEVLPAPLTALYRNSDAAWSRIMAGNGTASRLISVDMTLRMASGNRLVVDISDERGCATTSSMPLDAAPAPARSQQYSNQQSVMGKLGGTVYTQRHFVTMIPDLFIPNSALAALRRRAIEALDHAWTATYNYDYRRSEDSSAPLPLSSTTLSYHTNVANRLAREFYKDHGAQSIEPAIETKSLANLKSSRSPLRVMTTRYCLRREMGACLKNPSEARKLPANLVIRGRGIDFSLEFDCKKCCMYVIKQ